MWPFKKQPKTVTPEAFNAAIAACDTALGAIETYTTRANHRHAILDAKRLINISPDDFRAGAVATYDAVIAAFSDPADFEPYTEGDLHAHTVAVDALTTALDHFTAAFAALNSGDNLFATAAALHKAYCDNYAFAARAYSYAVDCAMATALEGQLQVAKDKWQLILLADRASNPADPDPVAIRARAAAFQARVTEDTTKANVLQEKASVGVSKAELLLFKAESFQARAEEVLQQAKLE
jgi:hypothetical protein